MCRMQYAALFAVSFCFVALKAFQQLNVQSDRHLWIIPTSLLMALFEICVVVGMVRAQTLWAAVPIGMGSGCGCLVAMWIHRRLRK